MAGRELGTGERWLRGCALGLLDIVPGAKQCIVNAVVKAAEKADDVVTNLKVGLQPILPLRVAGKLELNRLLFLVIGQRKQGLLRVVLLEGLVVREAVG